MAQVPHWDHPVRRWRVGQTMTREKLAQLCARNGKAIQDRYLEAIENGYRRPSYDLCVVLEKISEQALKVHDLRRHPLKREKKRKRSAA